MVINDSGLDIIDKKLYFYIVKAPESVFALDVLFYVLRCEQLCSQSKMWIIVNMPI